MSKAKKLSYLTEVKKTSQIEGLNFLTTYTTKNYSLFHKMAENRGATNGVEAKRVQGFVDLVNDDKFVAEDCHVRVNILFDVIDGSHKLDMAERLKLFVNFMIVPDKMFNGVDRRTFTNNVSLYNATDSTWKDRSNFASALASKERCAENILKLVGEVKDLKMTPTRVIGIVTNFEKGTRNGKQLREVYCNDTYADIMETSEFKVKFDGVVNFMQIISRANKNLRSYGVVRQLIIDLKGITTSPDWNTINTMLVKYISKDKDFDKMGDRQNDFKTISNGVIKLLVK